MKEEEKKPEEEPWTQVKADFELEKIGVSLYRGTNDLVSQFASYAVLSNFIGRTLTLDWRRLVYPSIVGLMIWGVSLLVMLS